MKISGHILLPIALLGALLASCASDDKPAPDSAPPHDAIASDSGAADITANDALELDMALEDTGPCNAAPITGDVDVLSAAELDALRGVTTIEGYLYLAAPTLATIDGLHCLKEIKGNLVLAGNTALQSLEGLSSVEKVGGKLYIEDNDSLVDLHGLEKIEALGLHLEIYTNAALVNVDGLDALERIEGVLHIYGNPELANLDGLSALSYLGKSLQIRQNVSLPTCEAQALWDQLTAAGWTGQMISNILGNDDQGSCD